MILFFVSILTPVYIVRGPSTDVPTENVSTEHATSGLHTTHTSAHAMADSGSGDEDRQGEYVSANMENKNNISSLQYSTFSGTVLTGNSRRDISQDDVNAAQWLTTASTSVAFMNRSVTWQHTCDDMLCKTGIGKYVVIGSGCVINDRRVINTSQPFTVHFITEPNKMESSRCELEIITPRNHYINGTVRKLSDEILLEFSLKVVKTDETEAWERTQYIHRQDVFRNDAYFLALEHILLDFETSIQQQSQVVTLYVNIKEGTYVCDLPLVMLTDTVGYITSPGFSANQNYPNSYDGDFDLNVEDNECALVYIARMYIDIDDNEYKDTLIFIDRRTQLPVMKINRYDPLRPRTFCFSIRIYFHTDRSINRLGFKIMFAILTGFQLSDEQIQISRFDCSEPKYLSVKLVFSCNILWDCEGGEDEKGCRYDDCGMEDTIGIGTKCYSLVIHQPYMSWLDAHNVCNRRGQRLATFENPDDFRQFKSLAPPVIPGYFVGAQLSERLQAVSIQALYRNIWQWVDGRTVFSLQIHDDFQIDASCALYSSLFVKVTHFPCHDQTYDAAFVCELDKQYEKLTDLGDSVLINPSTVLWNVSVVECSSDHVTRDFLSCDSQADCDASHSVTSCDVKGVTVPMFVCQRSRSTVSYTLVCDHMQHCSDNSDEDFCKYPECPSTSMTCRNGQCVQYYQQCDGKLDCHDGSDETLCSLTEFSITTSPPGSVYFNGRGNYRMERMDDSEECPPTHFFCPRGFCLPVYLRCNGIDDCVGREDEVGCHSYKCRGFYRCRGSKTCLHPQHVCNGIPQCPEQDDELLCDLNCPDQCRCQGLAFVCPSNFSATSHLAVRYLDASDSNMTLSDFHDNILLIGLRLSKCHIVSLSFNMTFPNMRNLDLSWNTLYRLNMQYFHPLKNLRVLVLSGNPIEQIMNSEPPGSIKMLLERVDLSHIDLEKFSSSQFASSPHIKMLNVSWSKLKSITEDGFHFIPELESIDLTGSRLINFPDNLLRQLTFLRTVHAENYKLCCEAMLPVHFDPKKCNAAQDLLASCEDLLKSNSYRIILWIFGVLSLVGNMFSIWARWYQQRQGSALSTFSVFVINLSVADFFMGVYLATIGTADFIYRGRYLWRDDEWKNSEACNMAGLFCLLSSETSAFIVCLITLDRFLVLRFPFGTLRFGRRSALFVCGVVWVVGISLAAIPALPMTSHWGFYRQTGICIPLPFTSREVFGGYDYSFGVSILLNLVLFLLIAVGQAFIYLAVRANSTPFFTDTRARDAAIARRLISVVVSDFLCWFPIGLLGLLASTGTPIPGELNVATATFVLPLNSALNPFLYTFNLLMEKRRKAQNEQLLKRLKLEIDMVKATIDKSDKATPESTN